MATSRRATIRVYGVNKRAGGDTQRLLWWLEDFVNVGDRLADYQNFATTHANFWPIPLFDPAGKQLEDWTPKAHKLFLAYQECLRRIWRREEQALHNKEVGFLLGMEQHRYFDRGGAIPELLRAAWADLPNAQCRVHTRVSPDWTRGEFVFTPMNDFQQAVYLLFRESWRARVCEWCSKCFLADKPAQRFCGSKCFGEAKRKRDLAYWRSDGAKRRKNRRSEKNASRGRRLQRHAQRRMPILRKPRAFPTR